MVTRITEEFTLKRAKQSRKLFKLCVRLKPWRMGDEEEAQVIQDFHQQLQQAFRDFARSRMALKR